MKNNIYILAVSILLTSSLAQALGFSAVEDAEVFSAKCTSTDVMGDNDYLRWFQRIKTEPLSRARVGKVEFENEVPELLWAYRKLVSKPSDQLDGLDIQIEKATSCRKVLCALGEIFGSAQALRLAYLQIKYEFNGSHLRHKNADALRIGELDDIILSISNLPAFMFPIEMSRQLTHFSRGYAYTKDVDPNHPELVTLANASVELFDAWNRQGRGGRQVALNHEIGHVLDFALGDISRTPDWLALSSWSVPKNNNIFEKKGVNERGFISVYAMTNPIEDFAESFIAYRYVPERLKIRNMGKYNFLKDRVFRGIEYSKATQCAEKHKSSQVLTAQDKKAASDILAELNRSLDKACIQSLTKINPYGSFRECLGENFYGHYNKLRSRSRIPILQDAVLIRDIRDNYIQGQSRLVAKFFSEIFWQQFQESKMATGASVKALIFGGDSCGMNSELTKKLMSEQGVTYSESDFFMLRISMETVCREIIEKKIPDDRKMNYMEERIRPKI